MQSILLIFVAFGAVAFAAKDPLGVAVKEDLPLVACDVCERTVQRAYEEVAKDRSANKKIDELEISEILESLSSPDKEAGEWLRQIDIIEATIKDKRYLSLVEPGGTSKCRNECATLVKSCQNLLNEEIDVDELASLLWRNKTTLKDLKSKVCTKWTKRCHPRRKELPLSYDRTDEEFQAIDEKDLEMERMMASMRAMGMGGSLYSRDDLGDMMGMDEDDLAEMGGAGEL